MPVNYRAEVIGSLLRPDYLKQARTRWQAGDLTVREFKKFEDRAVNDMIALQETLGLDVVTDGEMRRTHFIAPLTDVISGVKPIPAFTRVWKKPHRPGEQAETVDIQVQYAVVEKIHRTRSLTNEEFSYARGHATRPLKVTLPSPLMMTLRWSPEYSRDAYPDPFELFADAAAIVRDEAREWRRSVANISRSMPPSWGCSVIPRAAATISPIAGWIPIVSSPRVWISSTPSPRSPAWSSGSIYAAATTRAITSERAATRR